MMKSVWKSAMRGKLEWSYFASTVKVFTLLPGPPLPSSPLSNDMVDFRVRSGIMPLLSTEAFQKS